MIGYDNPKNLVKDYYSDIETSSQDGAYLAGVLAGKTTKTEQARASSSRRPTPTGTSSRAASWPARAASTRTSTFRFAQVGQAAYDDAAGGKRVMQATIAAGADVVFGMGDGATLGYLQAVETVGKKKVWFIDVIGNPTPIDKKGAVLSSVLWDFSKVFKQAIADINGGRYGQKYYTLGLNNGVSLLRTKYVSGANWALVKQARKGDHRRLDQGAADARPRSRSRS